MCQKTILSHFSKNIIISLLFVSLVFCLYLIYRLQPYEYYLQQREENIKNTEKKLQDGHFVDLNGFFFLGQPFVYLEKGKPEIALHWAEIAVADEYCLRYSYQNRADCHYYLGNYQKSFDDYSLSFSLFTSGEVFPSETNILETSIGMAKSQYQLGQKSIAAETFQKAILDFDDNENKRGREISSRFVHSVLLPAIEKGPENAKITCQDVIDLLESEKENSNEKEKYERTIEILSI